MESIKNALNEKQGVVNSLLNNKMEDNVKEKKKTFLSTIPRPIIALFVIIILDYIIVGFLDLIGIKLRSWILLLVWIKLLAVFYVLLPDENKLMF